MTNAHEMPISKRLQSARRSAMPIGLKRFNCRGSLAVFCNTLKTLLLIVMFYGCSISLTFYNQRFIHQFRFPLSITMTHLLTKFIIAAVIRWLLQICTGKTRITLGWKDYVTKVAPPGVASSMDIALSNWSFEYITISLYTMTKSTVIVFLLMFALLFKLEKPRCSLILIVSCIFIGLFMFTYESTQFNTVGFLLVLAASFISGLRWTLAQIVLQKTEIGLSNPLDMMYHIQPWMILSLLPLSAGFEGVHLAISEHVFGFVDSYLLARNMLLLLAGALLAFLLELSEFLVVCCTSSLTLSIAGIFKEVITLLLAAVINGDTMNAVNAVGLVLCLAGIVLHVVFKALHGKSAQPTTPDADASKSLLKAVDSDESSDAETVFDRTIRTLHNKK